MIPIVHREARLELASPPLLAHHSLPIHDTKVKKLMITTRLFPIHLDVDREASVEAYGSCLVCESERRRAMIRSNLSDNWEISH